MTPAKPTKAAKKRTTKTDARRQGKGQGMNWCAPQRRLALYLRDGAACAYCAKGIEDGVTLTLDHLVPHSKGGSNHEANLVTCCGVCNSSRGNKPLATFIRHAAAYHNRDERMVKSFIRATSQRRLAPFVAEAKALLALRGTPKNALAAMKNS